jgi:metal-responsive CopG/Arc/MetJ family transcriptional regulator
MNYKKVSITIPNQLYEELKKITDRERSKISRIVAEAIAEKLVRIEEEIYLKEVNAAFEDPEVIKEQKNIAELIAESTDVRELPW